MDARLIFGLILIVSGLNSIFLGILDPKHRLRRILFDPFKGSKAFHLIVGLLLMAAGIIMIYLRTPTTV